MSSGELPPLPDNRIVLGCGSVSVDFLAAVASYPKPDDKIKSTSTKVQGGGNAGNALTCAARLGLKPRLISKVADDPQGKAILDELEGDGVDSSFMVVSEGGNSPFTYVIVDNQTKTRTCISTPGYPSMITQDLTESKLSAALNGTRLIYFDGRLHETALVVAQEVINAWLVRFSFEFRLVVANLTLILSRVDCPFIDLPVQATRRGIPILIDAEKKRKGLDDILSLSNYVICSAKFPQAWTGSPSIASALCFMLLKLPNIKFAIVTLGEDGCIMLQRTVCEDLQSEELDVDDLLDTLKNTKNSNMTVPTCVSSGAVKLCAKGIGIVGGTLLLGTAEKIPPSELVDTTGAGDSFIGAVAYALCANMPPEKMLPFAAKVAGIGCRALGARTGLPRRTDPRLFSFLV